MLLNLAVRPDLVIPSLTFRLALLSGHGVERGCFLLHVLAAALGAFRVYFVFFQGENQFERFATIVADVVIHGHEGLPLDCDYELRLELYADTGRLSVCNPALQDTWDTRRLSGPKGGPFASLRMTRLLRANR